MNKLEDIQVGCFGLLIFIFIANVAYTHPASLFAIPIAFLVTYFVYGWQRYKTCEFCTVFDLLTKDKILTSKKMFWEKVGTNSKIGFSLEEIDLLKRSFPKSGLKSRFGRERHLDFDELSIVDEVDIAIAQFSWETKLKPFIANSFLESLAPSGLSLVSRIPSNAFYAFCRLTDLMKSNVDKSLESLLAALIFTFVMKPGISALNLYSWLEITLSTISFLALWAASYKIHKLNKKRKLTKNHEEVLAKYPNSLMALVIRLNKEAIKQIPDNPISQHRLLEKLVRQQFS